jgi:anthranilate synthase component 2
MGLKHKRYPVEGIQFHPESFMTEQGKELLKNFLKKELKND